MAMSGPGGPRSGKRRFDMRLHWRDLGTPRADRADGKSVELTGFPLMAPVRCVPQA
jgi:hypothetical protein